MNARILFHSLFACIGINLSLGFTRNGSKTSTTMKYNSASAQHGVLHEAHSHLEARQQSLDVDPSSTSNDFFSKTIPSILTTSPADSPDMSTTAPTDGVSKSSIPSSSFTSSNSNHPPPSTIQPTPKLVLEVSTSPTSTVQKFVTQTNTYYVPISVPSTSRQGSTFITSIYSTIKMETVEHMATDVGSAPSPISNVLSPSDVEWNSASTLSMPSGQLVSSSEEHTTRSNPLGVLDASGPSNASVVTTLEKFVQRPITIVSIISVTATMPRPSASSMASTEVDTISSATPSLESSPTILLTDTSSSPTDTSSRKPKLSSSSISASITSSQPPLITESTVPGNAPSPDPPLSDGAIVGIIIGATFALLVLFYFLVQYRRKKLTTFAKQTNPPAADGPAMTEVSPARPRNSIRSYISGINDRGWDAYVHPSSSKTCPHKGPKVGMCVCSRCWADQNHPTNIPIVFPLQPPSTVTQSHPGFSSELVSRPQSYPNQRGSAHYYSQPYPDPLINLPSHSRAQSASNIVRGISKCPPIPPRSAHRGAGRQQGISGTPVNDISYREDDDEEVNVIPPYEDVLLEQKRVFGRVKNGRVKVVDVESAGGIGGDEEAVLAEHVGVGWNGKGKARKE